MVSQTMTQKASDPPWNAIFTPKSIGIVGKTERFKGGFMFIQSLKNIGYRGRVYVISTDGGGGHGFEEIETTQSLPDGVEYVILAIPAREISTALRSLKDKGVKVAHIFSSGFGDLETETGRKREEDLKNASRETGIRIIGPNCLGVYSPGGRIAYPPGIYPEKTGNVGFISQSGGTAQSFAWSGNTYHFFHSKGISVGNSTDLTLEDFLAYMKDDPETEIIALYLEGVKDGDRFIRLIRETSMKKPVLILKAGLSDAGVAAVSSHTGIMAGNARTWEAAIRQAGGIRVETFDELVETTSAFAKKRGTPGHRIALVNRGGGEGVIAADLAPRRGLRAPPYTEKTQKALAELMPRAGTGFRNPLDFAAVGGFPGVFEKMLAVIDDDRDTDTIIYQHHIEFAHLFSRREYNEYLLDALVSFYRNAKKTLLVVLPLYYSMDEWARSFGFLASHGISTHTTITGAVNAAKHLAEYERIRSRRHGTP
jgi:acyl-CoA synthetase (NDP forming)